MRGRQSAGVFLRTRRALPLCGCRPSRAWPNARRAVPLTRVLMMKCGCMTSRPRPVCMCRTLAPPPDPPSWARGRSPPRAVRSTTDPFVLPVARRPKVRACGNTRPVSSRQTHSRTFTGGSSTTDVQTVACTPCHWHGVQATVQGSVHCQPRCRPRMKRSLFSAHVPGSKGRSRRANTFLGVLQISSLGANASPTSRHADDAAQVPRCAEEFKVQFIVHRALRGALHLVTMHEAG